MQNLRIKQGLHHRNEEARGSDESYFLSCSTEYGLLVTTSIQSLYQALNWENGC